MPPDLPSIHCGPPVSRLFPSRLQSTSPRRFGGSPGTQALRPGGPVPETRRRGSFGFRKFLGSFSLDLDLDLSLARTVRSAWSSNVRQASISVMIVASLIGVSLRRHARDGVSKIKGGSRENREDEAREMGRGAVYTERVPLCRSPGN